MELLTGCGSCSEGKVPAALANFPETGESGKIYVAQDTNKAYHWIG